MLSAALEHFVRETRSTSIDNANTNKTIAEISSEVTSFDSLSLSNLTLMMG